MSKMHGPFCLSQDSSGLWLLEIIAYLLAIKEVTDRFRCRPWKNKKPSNLSPGNPKRASLTIRG
jgi:hypothetical protein